jgi:acetyl esterase
VALDPHVQRIIAMLRAGGAAGAARLGVDERRNAFRKLMQICGGTPPETDVTEHEVNGGDGPICARIYSPVEARVGRLPAIVFFHGGGFVAGDLNTHHALCSTLSRESAARVVAVDYRLAPEYPFPAAPADACAATRWIVRHADALGIDRGRVALAGDSAGAVLAAVACRELHGKATQFAAQLLLCPITDFGGEAPSRLEHADGFVVDRATIEADLSLYLPRDHDRTDPLVSPLRATNLRGLPRAFVHTAEHDPMRDEGRFYAERLAASGVPVHYACHAGMIHLFYAMGGLVPYAAVALREIGAQMRAALSAETVA